MPRETFKEWLATGYGASTRATYWTDLSRIERHYGDLDTAYDLDKLASIRKEFEYSADDKRQGRPNPSKIPIDGDVSASLSTFRSELEVYKKFRTAESNPKRQQVELRKDALEQLKRKFLNRYPDFATLGFDATHGGYWEDERQYKDTVIARASALLATYDGNDELLGQSMLKIVEEKPANFVGWRVFRQIRAAGADAIRQLEVAFGKMLADRGDVATVAEVCAAKIHPLMQGADKPVFGQVRSLVTLGLALARPEEAIVVKTRYMQRAAKSLIGYGPFKKGMMTASEYGQVLSLAKEIYVVMRDDWGWAPRDLWDVQGFLWVTSELYTDEPEQEQGDEEDTMPETSASKMLPTNLILYGPPGTGKTFATAARAVELCDGKTPSANRQEVMLRYRELVERKRISFVTFHQSYAYEDFVEGLRPETGNDEGADGASSGGFSLRPRPGVFRQIAALARENRGRAVAVPSIDRKRQIFKMSLGRSDEEEGARLFSDAIKDGFVVLGWGGEIDWSDEKYSHFAHIRSRWQEDHKDATGTDSNVKQIYTLRANMTVGDLVVISDGNMKFRAIGEITGPYQFVPDYMGTFNHRRPVRWLWHSDESQPRELIYGKGFTQVAAYQLRSSMIDWPALEQIVAGSGDAGQTVGEPEAYVLIIDEINRANVSKVFGELITLIEPDKRANGENALTVTLPYSGETFGVPSNLHIIGTMNTADRSIALLDTALRRRFEFEELTPDPATLVVASAATGVDLVGVLSGLNARIEYLFDREHQIGHAFFMNCKTRDDLTRVMKTKVIPLLAEYFYENWEKLRQVLGETSDEGAFIGRTKLEPPFGVDSFDSDQERWRYEVRTDFPLDAYEQLKT